MPREIRQFLIFIGSPSGLEAERRLFAERIAHYNIHHGDPDGILFKPIGWEDTLPGHGRPQDLINEDLRRCDYAVFLFHNRWGSVAGSSGKVGTEEEWEVAEKLYADRSPRNLSLFFKQVDDAQLRDPGEQLKQVLAFRKSIEDGKRHLFRHFDQAEHFGDVLDALLAEWGRACRPGMSSVSLASLSEPSPTVPVTSPPAPNFDFWMDAYFRAIEKGGAAFNPHAALFCADEALVAQRNETECARAEIARGVAHAHLDNLQEALISFERVAVHLASSSEPTHRDWVARALINKGVTLGLIGRDEDAIAAFDAVLSRFGTAGEPALREQVAKALVYRGIALGELGRREDAIAAFDDVLSRFITAGEPELREQVASALVNKSVEFGRSGRREEATAACDEVLSRFGTDPEPNLRKFVARALYYKATMLASMGRHEEAVPAYDDLLSRIGTASELALGELAAKALYFKAGALRHCNRHADGNAALDVLVVSFGAATEPEIIRLVERARRRRK